MLDRTLRVSKDAHVFDKTIKTIVITALEDGESRQNLIFENMKKWKRPLIQSNFAFNDLADHRGAGPHGLSMFVNSDNSLYQNGDFDSESCYEVHISNNKIQNCQKIGDL